MKRTVYKKQITFYISMLIVSLFFVVFPVRVQAQSNTNSATKIEIPASASTETKAELKAEVKADVSLDPSLKPKEIYFDIPTVFEDTIVVERKAFDKAKKIVLSSYFSLDFSDYPYTMYSLNTDIGYVQNDFWEYYLSIAPIFASSMRPFTSKMIDAAQKYSINITPAAGIPQFQYGFSAYWSPMYGKDTWNAKKLIRSDMFLKIFMGMVNYDLGNGFRTSIIMGKTFLGKSFGTRLGAGGAILQTPAYGQTSWSAIALFELGFTFYF
jgi:hypothetical protein